MLRMLKIKASESSSEQVLRLCASAPYNGLFLR